MNSATHHNTTTANVNHTAATVNLANQRKRKASTLLTGQVNPCGCHCAGSTVAEYLDSLPIGYRFKPTDEELMSHYLKKKLKNLSLPKSRIIEANVYENHPKDLAAAYPQATEDAWYFFSSRDKKYSRGNRPSRNAGPGFWRATGADKAIKENETTIGGRKSLVYYEGRQPKGTKTNWMMYEYVVDEGGSDDKKFDDYVLCKIYEKKMKEKDVASNSQDENLTTDVKDQNEQADQNNAVTQFPTHQSMNNNIDQVMVPSYQQAYVASNQDVHTTHPQGENNHVVVQQSSHNSNPTIQYVENILQVPVSSQHMVPDHHLPMSVQMMATFQPVVGQSCATQLNQKYSHFPSTPQRSLYPPPQHGHVHPETYSCDPSSNPPLPKEAPAVLQGGNEGDGRANLIRNIELMLAKDGYDWLNTDYDCKFQFDKLEEQLLKVDESEKHEESKVEDWINYFLDRE